uniref:Uncharacterized protein n=1 Tax=Clytia hemisphaerica TaxID=252671 RepID=A0A7M5WQ18_9CNID
PAAKPSVTKATPASKPTETKATPAVIPSVTKATPAAKPSKTKATLPAKSSITKASPTAKPSVTKVTPAAKRSQTKATAPAKLTRTIATPAQTEAKDNQFTNLIKSEAVEAKGSKLCQSLEIKAALHSSCTSVNIMPNTHEDAPDKEYTSTLTQTIETNFVENASIATQASDNDISKAPPINLCTNCSKPKEVGPRTSSDLEGFVQDVESIATMTKLFIRQAPDLKDRLTSICKNVLGELSKPFKISSGAQKK